MQKATSERISFVSDSAATIEIRLADKRSLPEAFQIVTQYYAAFQVVERESLQDFVSHYFGERNGFWLATAGTAVVGCIGLRELASLPGSGEVKRLYVLPDYRRLQIAARLLQALEEKARLLGFEWLYLDTNETFVQALRFYRKHGYDDCERYNSNPQATIFLKRRL